jgi:hypothetical protein
LTFAYKLNRFDAFNGFGGGFLVDNLNYYDEMFDGDLEPFLVSEPEDFQNFPAEETLRNMAKSIPWNVYTQPKIITQRYIAAAVYVMQEYLTQVVRGASQFMPTASGMLVTSSGIEVMTKPDDPTIQKPVFLTGPVSGFVTFGLADLPPYCNDLPFEPAVTLEMNQSDDAESFSVSLLVTEAGEMTLLTKLLQDAQQLGYWKYFEKLYGVELETSVPIPLEAKRSRKRRMTCADYATAFQEKVLLNMGENECVESMELKFAVVDNTPLHVPLYAALSVLMAIHQYQISAVVDDYSAEAASRIAEAVIQAAYIKGIDILGEPE